MEAASLQPAGVEFKVHSHTEGSQLDSSISPAGDGFIVAWDTSYFEGGASRDVVGQRLSRTGAPIGGEFILNEATAGFQGFPRVSGSPDGSFVVGWDSQEMWGRVFSKTDTPVSGDIQLNTYTTQEQSFLDVALLQSGRIAAVWDSARSAESDQSGFSVHGRLVDPSGTPIGDQFQVNTTTASHQVNPSVLARPDGGFVVAWANGYSPYGGAIAAQRFSSDGLPLGAEIPVNVEMSDFGGRPQMAADVDGGFIVVWARTTAFGVTPTRQTIEARRFASDGTSLGQQMRLGYLDVGFARLPEVAPAGAGRFVVVWRTDDSYLYDFSTDGDGRSIQIGRLGPAGAIGPELIVNTYTTGNQDAPDVAAHPSDPNQFLIVWDGPGSLGPGDPETDYGIHAQWFEDVPFFDDDFEAGAFGAWDEVAP